MIERREFKRLMKKLESIERNVKMASFIQKEKSEKPRYPDLVTLSRFVEDHKVSCTVQPKYECTACTTKKRNSCWVLSTKKDRKKMLIAGVPYERIIMGNMKLSDLWILASYLKVYPVFGNKSQLVDRIIKRQFQLKEEGKIVETPKGVKVNLE